MYDEVLNHLVFSLVQVFSAGIGSWIFYKENLELTIVCFRYHIQLRNFSRREENWVKMSFRSHGRS